MSHTSKGPSMKEELVNLVKQKSGSSAKLSCEEARALAEEHGIGYGELGELLNELKIKITDCGLGCF